MCLARISDSSRSNRLSGSEIKEKERKPVAKVSKKHLFGNGLFATVPFGVGGCAFRHTKE
jgi:hypothetical protein